MSGESTCDVCGRPIFGKPITKYVEGAKLQVCQNCSKFGKSGSSPRTPPIKRKVSKGRRPYQGDRSEGDFVLVEDFGRLIKEAREKRKMTQDELARKIKEPLSLIRRIEQTRMNPSIQVIKKIEGLLNITLTEKVMEDHVPKAQKKSKPETTIGDFVKIKKKKE